MNWYILTDDFSVPAARGHCGCEPYKNEFTDLLGSRRRAKLVGFSCDMNALAVPSVPTPGESGHLLRKHIPELDGLRGCAIALVLLGHFTDPNPLSNHFAEWLKKLAEAGWIGVDLFFVLSGFLITRILLGVGRDAADLKAFFARRVLRIFPLYLASAAAVLLVLPRVLPSLPAHDPQFAQILSLQSWVWVHCTNIGMFLHPRGFQSATVSLEHFWSLSVEEHFYLVWPFLVFACSPRRLRTVCIGLIIGSALTRWTGLLFGADHYYVALTPCRLESLAMGGWIAAFSFENSLHSLTKAARILFVACGVGLGIFLAAGRGLWDADPWVQGPGLSLIALLFAAALVIVLTANPKGAVAISLRWKPIRLLGMFSYGIYVIHGLIRGLLDYLVSRPALVNFAGSEGLATLILVLTKSLISIAVAVLSYYCLEQPFLRLKKVFTYCPR